MVINSVRYFIANARCPSKSIPVSFVTCAFIIPAQFFAVIRFSLEMYHRQIPMNNKENRFRH